MRIIFSSRAWREYTLWFKEDRLVLKKINRLIKEIYRSPFHGIGKPEPLRFELTGCWSRRITGEHRLVYRVSDNSLEILSCRYHYNG